MCSSSYFEFLFRTLNFNSFEGSIPTQIGQLSILEDMYVVHLELFIFSFYLLLK